MEPNKRSDHTLLQVGEVQSGCITTPEEPRIVYSSDSEEEREILARHGAEAEEECYGELFDV